MTQAKRPNEKRPASQKQSANDKERILVISEMFVQREALNPTIRTRRYLVSQVGLRAAVFELTQRLWA